MKLFLPLGVGLLNLVLSGTAGAQALQVPLVEVGGQVGFVGAIAEGLHALPIAGPRLTVNISQQNAIELAAETLMPSSGIYGLYFLQYKRTTRRPADWSGIRPFYTAGTGGYYSSFSIDDADSNGAIAIQFTGASGQSGGTLVLRGPDLVPPALSIRAVRIRYQWLQDSPSNFGLSFSVTIDATNAPSADVQPRHFQSLKAGPGWKEIELCGCTEDRRHHAGQLRLGLASSRIAE